MNKLRCTFLMELSLSSMGRTQKYYNEAKSQNFKENALCYSIYMKSCNR